MNTHARVLDSCEKEYLINKEIKKNYTKMMVDQTVRLGCWSRLVISKPKLTQVKHTHTRVMAGGIHIHTHCVYGLPAGSMAGLAPHQKLASYYGRRSELSAVG